MALVRDAGEVVAIGHVSRADTCRAQTCVPRRYAFLRKPIWITRRPVIVARVFKGQCSPRRGDQSVWRQSMRRNRFWPMAQILIGIWIGACTCTVLGSVIAASAAEQKIGAPPEAMNMRLVGYNDLQGRSAYQPTIHHQGNRYIAYIGHHGGTPEVPKPVNPLTGQPEIFHSRNHRGHRQTLRQAQRPGQVQSRHPDQQCGDRRSRLYLYRRPSKYRHAHTRIDR